MKIIFLLIIIIAGQLMSQDLEFSNQLYNSYDNYNEPSLTHRRFKHADIVPLIERLKNKNIYTVNKAGKSAEGRDIYLIKLGTGKTKVFLWSQMHGDEPTATMALFDIFNFLNSEDFKEVKKVLLENLTIYIMPMVNPDGAEVYERRNLFNIDINRDAVRQQTPEGKVLRTTFEELKADFGFNLHDQSTRYSVGNSFRAYRATHTPEIFLFDSQRKLVYQGKIDDNWKEPDKVKNSYLREALDELLNGEEISVPETWSIGCTIKWKQ